MYGLFRLNIMQPMHVYKYIVYESILRCEYMTYIHVSNTCKYNEGPLFWPLFSFERKASRNRSLGFQIKT